MLISRTPMRTSTGGGGTDLPSYYRRFGGCVISAAINKYISIAINRMLKGELSARFAPSSALLMGLFVLMLYWMTRDWPASTELVGISEFLRHPLGWAVVLDLLGVAIAGGMFVVPLYAFLTTTVPKSETARTVAANNIVNSGAMVVATMMLTGLVLLGVSVAETLFLVAVASIISAWLGHKLHLACD